jgi:hypothetical protein
LIIKLLVKFGIPLVIQIVNFLSVILATIERVSRFHLLSLKHARAVSSGIPSKIGSGRRRLLI